MIFLAGCCRVGFVSDVTVCLIFLYIYMFFFGIIFDKKAKKEKRKKSGTKSRVVALKNEPQANGSIDNESSGTSAFETQENRHC